VCVLLRLCVYVLRPCPFFFLPPSNPRVVFVCASFLICLVRELGRAAAGCEWWRDCRFPWNDDERLMRDESGVCLHA